MHVPLQRAAPALLAIALLCAAAPAAGGGAGLPVNLDLMMQGPGACQAALPAYEGQIRKRPLAIQNEGTQPAFVSCSLPHLTALDDPQYGISMFFVNIRATAATVKCTGVTLQGKSDVFTYLARTREVPGNTGAYASFEQRLSWDERDEDGAGWYTTVSCELPPGTGISFLQALHGEVLRPG